MNVHAERLPAHTAHALHTATKANEAAVQVADTYMQGGAAGWQNSTEAELFDAACTLRAAADRLDALRRERASAQIMATSLAHSFSTRR